MTREDFCLQLDTEAEDLLGILTKASHDRRFRGIDLPRAQALFHAFNNSNFNVPSTPFDCLHLAFGCVKHDIFALRSEAATLAHDDLAAALADFVRRAGILAANVIAGAESALARSDAP